MARKNKQRTICFNPAEEAMVLYLIPRVGEESWSGVVKFCLKYTISNLFPLRDGWFPKEESITTLKELKNEKNNK